VPDVDDVAPAIAASVEVKTSLPDENAVDEVIPPAAKMLVIVRSESARPAASVAVTQICAFSPGAYVALSKASDAFVGSCCYANCS